MDVSQAYIRAKLDEEIFVKLPRGCSENCNKFAKLERALLPSLSLHPVYTNATACFG